MAQQVNINMIWLLKINFVKCQRNYQNERIKRNCKYEKF
jgi:hypothetical protein